MTYSTSIISAYNSVFFNVTEHSSQQTSSSSANTATVVLGSEATYTPAADAANVIYEIFFYSQIISNDSFVSFVLQHYQGGSWQEIDSKYVKNLGVGSGTSQNMRYSTKLKYLIPTWTGSKQLRLVVASDAADQELQMHALTDWDGTSSTSDFCNTNLLIYSV